MMWGICTAGEETLPLRCGGYALQARKPRPYDVGDMHCRRGDLAPTICRAWLADGEISARRGLVPKPNRLARPYRCNNNNPTEISPLKPKPNQPHRRATRLRGYDYSQTGGYFITICVQNQKCLFGEIIDRQMYLNDIGKIVVECWNYIPQHFCSVELDICIVMPNHIHGIIVLGTKGTEALRPAIPSQSNRRGEVPSPASTSSTSINRRGEVPSPTPTNRRSKISSSTLGQVVAYFKYQSTKYINQHRDMPGTRIWQRNYYDHVIQDDIDLQRIRQYITHNPMQWELDQLHPNNLSK